MMKELAYNLRVTILPMLIVSGVLLNTLSFIVMRRIRNSVTSRYMGILGLVDSSVLLIGGASLWMHTLDSTLSLTSSSSIACKVIPFLMYSFSDLSVFIIVIMTGERFYAVWRPLNIISKKRYFKMTMFLACSACSLINCHFLFTHSIDIAVQKSDATAESIKKNRTQSKFEMSNDMYSLNYSYYVEERLEMICIDVMWNTFYEKYWVYIDATIYSFLPSLLLTVFNVLIIRYLFKAADESLKLKHFKSKSMVVNSIKNNTENGEMLTDMPDDCRLSILKNINRPSNGSNLIAESSALLNQKGKRPSLLTTSTFFSFYSKKSINNPNQVYLFVKNPSFKFNNSTKKKTKHDLEARLERSGTITSYKSVMPSKIDSTLKRLNVRLTLMLVVLNISFCIFSMPMVILQIIYYSLSPLLANIPRSNHTSHGMINIVNKTNVNYHFNTEKATVSDIPIDETLITNMDLLKAIAELLQYLNHSSNFFLYSLSGKTFRKETQKFLKCTFVSMKIFFKTKRVQLYDQIQKKRQLPNFYI
jgi:hypothetical protein